MTLHSVIKIILNKVTFRNIGMKIAYQYPNNNKSERLKQQKKYNDDAISFRPLSSVISFLLIFGVSGGACFVYFLLHYLESNDVVALGCSILLLFCGIYCGCWAGSYLFAQITISKDRVIMEHAEKLHNKKYRVLNALHLGLYHVDVLWSEIHTIKLDKNLMLFILHNGERYLFPIGWCDHKAIHIIAQHKSIESWSNLMI